MQALFDVGKQVATIKTYRSAISAVLKGFEARHQKNIHPNSSEEWPTKDQGSDG